MKSIPSLIFGPPKLVSISRKILVDWSLTGTIQSFYISDITSLIGRINYSEASNPYFFPLFKILWWFCIEFFAEFDFFQQIVSQLATLISYVLCTAFYDTDQKKSAIVWNVLILNLQTLLCPYCLHAFNSIVYWSLRDLRFRIRTR